MLRVLPRSLPSVGRSVFTGAPHMEAALVCKTPAEENFRLRQHLALSYRLLDDLSLNEGSCNHLTVMAPPRSGAGEEVMLIAPGFVASGGGLDWSKVTASSLLGLEKSAGDVVEGEGVPELSGACIHLGVRRARPTAKVVMHTHTPYATALGCLQDPTLLMIHQNSCRFLGRVAYDSGYQPAVEMDEGERLGEVLGNKDVLMMCHHGTLIVAENIHIAFDDLYYLERACMTQLLAMGAAGRDALREMPREVQETTAQWIMGSEKGGREILDKYSAKHFYARWNSYKADNSSVFT